MEIILATGNDHKVKEIQSIFQSHTILNPKQLGLNFDFDEIENTFYGNALGKAASLYKLAKKPVLADDSGLCVNALNGEPGIFSARYGSLNGGPNLDAAERNNLLLKNLSNAEDRSAYFVCSMVLYFHPDRFFIVQETFDGEIALEPYGQGGFGYDPIFFLPEYGCTVAELADEEKNKISHRGKASQGILKLISE